MTVRTLRGQRDVDDLVDLRWGWAMSMPPMLPTGATSGPARRRRRRALRERRGLPLARSAPGVERLRQPRDLTAQAIAFAFQLLALARQIRALALQAGIVVAQPIRLVTGVLDLAAQTLQLALGLVDRRR
jgi:hypothetical protein